MVIPKPTQDVYNVYIMNKNFVATEQLSNQIKDSGSQSSNSKTANPSDNNLSDADIQNILRTSMNNFNYRDANAKSKSVEVQSDLLDVIGFRITMNPAINSDAYKVQTLKGTLLSNDGQFNFEEFYTRRLRVLSKRIWILSTRL